MTCLFDDFYQDFRWEKETDLDLDCITLLFYLSLHI